MPEEYKDTKMLVICNDCLEMSEVPFHILGGKCTECRSYNTTRADSEGEKLKFEKSKSEKLEKQKKEQLEKQKNEQLAEEQAK